MYKIFSNIVNDRIYNLAETSNLIDECQAEYRHGYSVTDNIFILQSMIEKSICKSGGCFYVLYVDFNKAFESLMHE